MADVGVAITNALEKVFTRSTPWEFTSSAGLSLSVAVIGGAGGMLEMKQGGDDKTYRLYYGIIGGSIGPLPFGGSFSTPDMWSTGVGKIRARTDAPLTFSDMTGPMCVVSGSFVGGTATFGQGLSTSIYFLGVPAIPALTSFAIPMVVNWIATGATQARALGMMVGRAIGADAGISVEVGYGR
jgi:hypothetical protein